MAYFTALRIEDHGAGPEQGPVLATASCTFKEQVHYPPGGRQSLPVAPARPSQLRGGGTTEGRGACPRGSRRRPLVPNQEDSTAPTSESTRRTTAVRGAMGIAPRLDLRVLGGQDLRGQEIGELIANHVFLAAAKRLSSRRAVGSADSYAGAARVDPQDPRGRPSGFDSLASCRLRRQLRRGRARAPANLAFLRPLKSTTLDSMERIDVSAIRRSESLYRPPPQNGHLRGLPFRQSAKSYRLFSPPLGLPGIRIPNHASLLTVAAASGPR